MVCSLQKGGEKVRNATGVRMLPSLQGNSRMRGGLALQFFVLYTLVCVEQRRAGFVIRGKGADAWYSMYSLIVRRSSNSCGTSTQEPTEEIPWEGLTQTPPVRSSVAHGAPRAGESKCTTARDFGVARSGPPARSYLASGPDVIKQSERDQNDKFDAGKQSDQVDESMK